MIMNLRKLTYYEEDRERKELEMCNYVLQLKTEDSVSHPVITLTLLLCILEHGQTRLVQNNISHIAKRGSSLLPNQTSYELASPIDVIKITRNKDART